MKIKQFIEHLKMYPEDMEVYLQTTPNDLCSPVKRASFSQTTAHVDERYGLQPAILVLTAFIPDKP